MANERKVRFIGLRTLRPRHPEEKVIVEKDGDNINGLYAYNATLRAWYKVAVKAVDGTWQAPDIAKQMAEQQPVKQNETIKRPEPERVSAVAEAVPANGNADAGANHSEPANDAAGERTIAEDRTEAAVDNQPFTNDSTSLLQKTDVVGNDTNVAETVANDNSEQSSGEEETAAADQGGDSNVQETPDAAAPAEQVQQATSETDTQPAHSDSSSTAPEATSNEVAAEPTAEVSGARTVINQVVGDRVETLEGSDPTPFDPAEVSRPQAPTPPTVPPLTQKDNGQSQATVQQKIAAARMRFAKSSFTK